MVGRYIKGSCARVRGFFYLISWLGGSCQSNFQREITVIRYILVSERVFSFKRKMASLETYVSVSPEMENTLENSITIQNLMLEVEELKRAKERTKVKLAMLEANIVKEPMKCERARAKLSKSSQHTSVESYANEFQNLGVVV